MTTLVMRLTAFIDRNGVLVGLVLVDLLLIYMHRHRDEESHKVAAKGTVQVQGRRRVGCEIS